MTRGDCFLVKAFIVLVILAGGAAYDLRDHRIPNWWVLGSGGIGLGIIWWLYTGGAEAAWQIPVWFLVRLLAAATVFFPFFYVRMIGAGDIKLMALICGFLGFLDGSLSIAYGFLIGAAMALIKMLVQKNLFQRLNYLYVYIRRLILTKEVTAYHNPSRDGYANTIPFGLCLFLGTLVYLFFIKH